MEGHQLPKPPQGLRSKQIKENLILLFCSILHEYGPLSVNSSEFQQVWTSITTDQQNIIQISGGLSNFLLQSNNISFTKPDILSLKKDISEDCCHTFTTTSDQQHFQTHPHTSNQVQTASCDSLSLQNIVHTVFGDVLTPDKNQKNTQNCPRKSGVSVTESATQDICIDDLITEEPGSNHRNRSQKKGRKRAKNKEALCPNTNSLCQIVMSEEKPESNVQCRPGSSNCVSMKPSTYCMVAAKSAQSKKKTEFSISSSSKKTARVPSVSTGRSGKDVSSDEGSLCSICHENLQDNKINKLQCGHIYHDMCIRKWLEIQKTCPACRVLVLLNDEFPPLSFDT